jgi:hypothetical protein
MRQKRFTAAQTPVIWCKHFAAVAADKMLLIANKFARLLGAHGPESYRWKKQNQKRPPGKVALRLRSGLRRYDGKVRSRARGANREIGNPGNG